jgi:FlaA1/EpsC-like NDP-sugar epimerase
MFMDRFTSWLLGLPRWAKRIIMLGADAVALPCVMYAAFAIRLGEWPVPADGGLLLLLALVAVVTPVLLWVGGFYRAVVRFFGNEMVKTIFGAVTASTLVQGTALLLGGVGGVPRSVLLISWALSLLYLGGSRYLIRNYFSWALHGMEDTVPVAIYGAGGGGRQLALALSQARRYRPVLYVDDDAGLRGTLIQGIPVVGRDQLPAKLKRYGAKTVVMAMPTASRQRRLDIAHFLGHLGVEVMSVPALPDIMAGTVHISDVRDVAIEDLLGRDPVPPNAELLAARIAGKSVMVTGAGGSIGSELCRQILRLGPKRLVLFERGEYELYTIDQELRQRAAELGLRVEIMPVLGTVVDRRQVEAVCRDQAVETVFHAAAYKHVPIVEANPAAGIRNNILGTLHAALAAEAAGVERFVLISTDKAVRPTNVMGATKRFAEMELQALAARGSKTVFTMVRFGNVLGSSGSVVPLFRKQILAGGPVTLTHRDITRYFMTIPEAAQLVIQAGAMAEGGEVFVLDMGAPVKIYDLAHSMIGLMGFSVREPSNPNGDITIKEVGLRPGEKLYEELLIGDDCTGTRHPMIMQAHETRLAWPEMQRLIGRVSAALDGRDTKALLELLHRHVEGFVTEDATRAVDNIVPLEKAARAGGAR